MPRVLTIAVAPSLSALLLFAPACAPTSSALPGEPVGEYSVVGSLESNACGAGYDAPSQVYFHVELRRTPGTPVGYWKLPEAPIAQGTVTGQTYRFVDRQEVVALEGEPDIGVAGCVLERTETVELTLREADGGATIDAGPATDGGETTDGGSQTDAGGPDLSGDGFTGTTTVRVGIVPGSDCAALLSAYGGPFPTLPCELHVTLDGDRLD